MEVEIITNNQPRQLLDWVNLTKKEQKEISDLLPSDMLDGNLFFRYKKQVYPLSEILAVGRNPSLAKWGGYSPDTYFSGIVTKLVPEMDSIIVGRYYS